MNGLAQRWRWSLALLAVTAMVATGCNEEAGAESAEETTGELVADDSPAVEAAVEEESSRPVVSEPAVRDVDEEGIDETPRLGEDVIGEELAEKVEKVDLPVLLPDDADFLDKAFFLENENFYTASIQIDDEAGELDHTIVVQGSRMVQNVPGQGEVRHELGEEYHIERIHKIPTLTFERFGISYQVHVECNRPHENRRCTDDDYIESIANSLTMAGGQ